MPSSCDFPYELNPAYQPLSRRDIQGEVFTVTMIDHEEKKFSCLITYHWCDDGQGFRVVEYDYRPACEVAISDDDLDYDVREEIRGHFGHWISFHDAINKVRA